MSRTRTPAPYLRRRGRTPGTETIAGRLRASDYKRLVKDFREARLSHVAAQKEAAKRGGKISSLLSEHGSYWWYFYDLSFPEHLALMCIGLGWGEKLQEIAKTDNPTRSFLEFAAKDDEDEENPFLRMAPDVQAAFLNLLLGVLYSIESICYYGLSVHELLDRASEGDSKYLLWAVSIDRCALSSEKAGRILAAKQIQGDKAFFSGLFKRIKSPHAGRKQYVELRYFRRIMEEAGSLGFYPASTDG